MNLKNKTGGILLAGLLFSGILRAQSDVFQPGYHFSSGDRFDIASHSNSDSYFTVQGISQRTSEQSNNTLELTVSQVNPDQSALITGHYTGIFVHASSNDLQTTIHTQGASQGPFDPLFRSLIGKNFRFTMYTNGLIGPILGLDSVIQAAYSAIPRSRNRKERNALRELLKNLYGSQTLANDLNQWLPKYGDSQVHIGDSWQETLHLEGSFGGELSTVWKLEYGDKYGLQLSSQGKLISDPAETKDLGGGFSGNADLNGSFQGNYQVDPASGWPTLSVLHIEIKGHYTYLAGKGVKSNLQVPVRMVSDASYRVTRFHP